MLLQQDDARHVLSESFRNVRSSIFFMPYEGPRPKTFLVTSAIPNEGNRRSRQSPSHGFAGARTFLSMAIFGGAPPRCVRCLVQNGFSEVLQQEVNWRQVRGADFVSKPVSHAARQDDRPAE
jgi:hypothetical protein